MTKRIALEWFKSEGQKTYRSNHGDFHIVAVEKATAPLTLDGQQRDVDLPKGWCLLDGLIGGQYRVKTLAVAKALAQSIMNFRAAEAEAVKLATSAELTTDESAAQRLLYLTSRSVEPLESLHAVFSHFIRDESGARPHGTPDECVCKLAQMIREFRLQSIEHREVLAGRSSG